MHDHQRDFLALALHHQVLRFGEFTLKSGRVSPYFFNAGLFNDGAALAALGRSYAQTLLRNQLGFDMLFGPAYKGIALATTVAIALSDQHARNVPVAFNRKEAKSHGEAGSLIGASLRGRVLIVDDVITAGTAVREAIELIRSHGATPAGVLIALDRQERGHGEQSAVDEVRAEFGIPVVAIAGLAELLQLTGEHSELIQHQAALLDYRNRYGIAA